MVLTLLLSLSLLQPYMTNSPQYDSILGGQSTVLGLDTSPLTIPDISNLFTPDVEMAGLWAGATPWLDSSTLEFERMVADNGLG